MQHPLNKTGIFLLEALNSVATTYYFYFIYFFMQERFGFGNMQNLALAAGSGFLYMLAAMFGGRFGQRKGYLFALGIGFGIMAVSLLVGTQVNSVTGHLLVLAGCTIGMCFTWPNLEAAVSHGEPPLRLQRNVGIYNVVWAGGGAVAYFTGGALVEAGGGRGIFIVPAIVHIVQLALTFWLVRQSRQPARESFRPLPLAINPQPAEERARSPVSPERFLKMAWVANPFAYLAINAAVPVMPGIARKLELTPKLAGFFCSIWFFSRAAAFLLFWLWPGWHYRFRYLLAAYLALIGAFGTILVSRNFGLLVGAQIVFGLALGLIYYSSLYYSMDASEDKGDHGGFHEAAIGAGNCSGPLIGALALYFLPGHPNSGVVAVCLALAIGLAWLLRLRWAKV
ncbi:MAG TPA: MFS transporter [Methylomirabilota bacterium]|nr:MFS transporter [Methylomirabilota bacterium]